MDEFYIPDAQECMTCGFCIPRCPTFKVLRNEAESPRGRLRVISALRSGVEPSVEDRRHLEACLQCRACETICPSKVAYGPLLDRAKARLENLDTTSKKRRRLRKLGLRLVTQRTHLRRLGRLARFYQRSGLRALFRVTGLKKVDALLPTIPEQGQWQSLYPTQGERRGNVGLFTGCVADVIDRMTLAATIRLLNRLDYDVHVPGDQNCCGALHLHHGDVRTAVQLAQKNITAFEKLDVQAVVYVASGCGLTLSEYEQLDGLPEGDKQATNAFAGKLKEISQFLAETTWPEDITFAPLEKTVAVHEPCSLRNSLGLHEQPYELLRRIPGLTITSLPENGNCCGAGGMHMLTHPEIARPLRDEKVTALKNEQADILITSNIGCALHLGAGISESGLDVETLHPVVLLERQLRG